MRILVIGTGGVGSAFASIARRRTFFEHCALADYERERAETVVASADDGRFSAHAVDASSRQAVAELVRSTRADAVLNAVDPRFNEAIFDACFDAGVTYLDMAMTLSEPHPERPYELPGVKLGDYQFERSRAWEERGQLALVGIGVEPGASDVFARHAADELFSEIDEVGVRDGSSLVVEGYDFAPTFSIWTTIEECLNPPVVWERGRGWFTTAPFSEPEVFEFPEGIGPVECVNVEHEEVLLVPRWVECGRVTFKYGLGDEFIEVLKTLHRLGLDRKEPVRVKGIEIAPRDVVAASLPDPATLGERMAGKTCAGTLVTGTGVDGRPRKTYVYHVVDARVRLAGGRLADRAEPGRRARAARHRRVGGHGGARPRGVPGPAVPRPAGRVRVAARPARAHALS
jgi:saccharopine dehydrogenase-like NADP-dependent oxidoreductase